MPVIEQIIQKDCVESLTRQELLKQAFDVIIKLDDNKLIRIMEEINDKNS